MSDFYMWLILGVIPYKIKWRGSKSKQLDIEFQALLWSVKGRCHHGKSYEWMLNIPVIVMLRDATWSAVIKMCETSLRRKP